MTRREQLAAVLADGPKTLPQVYTALQISRGNASRVLADAAAAGEIERSGVRRKTLYSLPGAQVAPAAPLWRVWA